MCCWSHDHSAVFCGVFVHSLAAWCPAKACQALRVPAQVTRMRHSVEDSFNAAVQSRAPSPGMEVKPAQQAQNSSSRQPDPGSNVHTWPFIIAHRGASGELPEHTRVSVPVCYATTCMPPSHTAAPALAAPQEAYLRAIEQGADAIECDVVLSAGPAVRMRAAVAPLTCVPKSDCHKWLPHIINVIL